MSPNAPTEAHRMTVRALRREEDEAWVLMHEEAAQLIAESEARAVAAEVTMLTCTNHNDQQRAACPVCLVAALTAERDQLQAALLLGQENCDDVYDELRADSDELRGDVVKLTAERDQLRGENATLRAAQKACEACDEPTAFEVRQLRAEVERTDAIYQRACEVEHELRAEVKRMTRYYEYDHKCLYEVQERCELWKQRAMKAEAGLAVLGQCHEDNCRGVVQIASELDTERERAERYRLASLKLDAELVIERARLDWIFSNCKVEANDYTTGNRDVYAIYDREDLGAAMKEDAK